MSNYYSANLLRMLRNQIPIDEVITDLLNLEIRNVNSNNALPLPAVPQLPYRHQP